MSIDTVVGKQSILKATSKALTEGDCSRAIELIEPLYDSKFTDNEVRLVYASAHGCNAGINFFQLLGDLVNSPPVGTQLWTTAAKLFYDSDSSTLDKRIESGRRAQQALMAIVPSGTVISIIDQVNSGSFNPGSLLPLDRTSDSNLYLALVSLSSLGALQDRYSAPDTTSWARTKPLGYTAGATDGWENPLNTAGEGCDFAASFLNFVDSIDRVAVDPGGSGGAALLQMTSQLKAVMGDACNAGCKASPLGVIGGIPIPYSTHNTCAFTDDQCAGSASRPCPVELRNRTSCSGLATNRASCAAAGLARFINQHPQLGWP